MEFISSEDFLKQPKKVQEILMDWYLWRTIPPLRMFKTINNTAYPIWFETQLREFIEDKAKGLIQLITVMRLSGYREYRVKVKLINETYDATDDVVCDDFLQALWQIACKIAQEAAEQEEISKLIEERLKNDDGTRYTTEDIKRLRNQRGEQDESSL